MCRTWTGCASWHQPFWASAVGRYVDQRHVAALALAPSPETDSDNLLLKVDVAKGELDAVIDMMRLHLHEIRERLVEKPYRLLDLMIHLPTGTDGA